MRDVWPDELVGLLEAAAPNAQRLAAKRFGLARRPRALQALGIPQFVF
jgi:hypothetical protein